MIVRDGVINRERCQVGEACGDGSLQARWIGGVKERYEGKALFLPVVTGRRRRPLMLGFCGLECQATLLKN